jgi:hypothetical protein
MIRRLELSSLLFLLAACSAAPNPRPDGGDAHPDGGDARPDGGDAHPDGDDARPDGDDARPDEGTPEAGPPDSSFPDERPSDGASPDGADGPGDGGAPSCDEAAHDPVLGTARLGAAYRVVEWAALPVTSWLPVAVVDEVTPDGGVGLVVYGYAGDGRTHRLGVWPQLDAPDATNLAFDAVSPADRMRQVLTTPLLATTQGQLLAGYRTVQSGGFVGGGVSLFDTARPNAGTRWLAAPGIESALGLGSFFLVGGDGLGDAAGMRGVYGVDLADATPRPGAIAKFPTVPNETVRPGLMAATSNGLVAMGYYLDLAARHSVRLPSPSLLTEALSGGPVIDLAAAPELTQADDVANLTSFGQGVAVLHTRQVRGVLPALGRLDDYRLSRPGGDAGTVVGTPVTMLSASDEACTVVSQLVPVPGGLTVIVGLWDRNGQRLVRLAAR